MVWLILLAACRAPVIGMEIAAEVTCDGECFGVGNYHLPCRCNPNRFDRDAGVVEVERDRLGDEAPTVAYSVEYASELSLCARDGVVADAPVAIPSVEGEPLYALDDEGALTPLASGALVSAGPDELVFEYPAGTDTTVREAHRVVFRDAMTVRTYEGVPCCETGARAPLGWAAGVALALAAGRRRRG